MLSQLILPLIYLSTLFSATEASAIDATPANPTVKLDKATVIGATNGSVTSYRGIPYAQPPVGNLRLRLPQLIESYNGTIDATQPATQCLQLVSSGSSDMPAEITEDLAGYLGKISSEISTDAPQGEDCLTVNIRLPAGTTPDAKLPVLAYIYGGGFTVGSTELYPGTMYVERSIELGQPVIYVAINYRLNVFGFLGGKEVKNAGVGNLGLQDQRAALRWINKYISAFGGDPERVTLWGPSAGSISVSLQLLTNGGDTEGLFHAAVMDSGSPVPTGPIEKLQSNYDGLVELVGCGDSTDSLDCLRQVPVDTLVSAASALPSASSYSGVGSILEYIPHADGVFLTAPPHELVSQGSVADVPIISCDSLDEGTVFAAPSFNITTDAEFEAFVQQWLFPSVSIAALEPIFLAYPNDPAQGSPFGTGEANQLSPQYKRMAALQGDIALQAPRRFFIDSLSGRQPIWGLIGRRGSFTGLGYAHMSDSIPMLAEATDFTDYIIQFGATRDPNGGPSNRTISWPQYDKVQRQVLQLEDGDVPLVIGVDDARRAATDVLTAFSVTYPL